MGYEHLSTISKTKSDEVIKSSVKNLVQILSEYEVTSDNENTLFDSSPKFDYLEEFSGELMPTSIINEERIKREHEEYISLMEKLLTINSFLRPLENFHTNTIIETLPSSPIPVQDSDSLREEIDIFTDTDDLMPPGIESDDYVSEGELISAVMNNIDKLNEDECFDPGGGVKIPFLTLASPLRAGGISLGWKFHEFADELAHIISPPKYDCFYFRDFPNPGEWISSLNSRIRENLSSTTRVNLPVEDDHSPLLAYVVWIFLAYLTYPVIPPHLHSFGNEDTIFDPGIAINCFYSFKPGLSRRCGTFKKFNNHRSHLNESPMEMLFSTCFPMDQ
nr:hypothetical protein [Tanacetum cinerariifolium]